MSSESPTNNHHPQTGECTSTSASSLSFTKFEAQGYSSGVWATDKLIASNNFTTTVKIPARLKAGNYVLRHEIIALHGAGSFFEHSEVADANMYL